MELYVAILSGIVAALALWWTSTFRKKYPPGPWGLPILGYLPFLGSKPYLTLTKLGKKYGDVFSLRMGFRNVVVLNDFKSTKEAFYQDAFIGRPREFPFKMNQETFENGAFFGLPWKEQRRYCLQMLRDVGFGKSKMEGHMQEEINELLEYIEKNEEIPFCMRNRLTASMSNNIASLLYGKRLKYEDPVRKNLTDSVNESARSAQQTGWLIFFPIIYKIVNALQKEATKEFVRTYTWKEIEEHEKTLDPNNIRDFIDGYLLEVKKRKNHPTFTKRTLQDMSGTFFGAGTETVRLSLEWLLLLAASNQEAQSRIRREIQEVVGQNRLPVWPDHQEMPYTEAFIMETLRWRTLLPINLVRLTIADTELNGYFIPKNTLVLSNTWNIHQDPRYWGADADRFRPERFLTADGKEIKKWEHYTPFSIGKRSCPGESLAKVEIFLYFASIMQRFQVKMPEGKVANFEATLGVGLQPEPQDIVFTKIN